MKHSGIVRTISDCHRQVFLVQMLSHQRHKTRLLFSIKSTRQYGMSMKAQLNEHANESRTMLNALESFAGYDDGSLKYQLM